MNTSRRLLIQASVVVALGTIAIFTTPRTALAGGLCEDPGTCDWCSGGYVCSNDCPISSATMACNVCGVGVECIEDHYACSANTFVVRCLYEY